MKTPTTELKYLNKKVENRQVLINIFFWCKLIHGIVFDM